MGDHQLLKGIKDIKDVKGVNVEAYNFTLSTAAITEIMIELAKEEELDIDLDAITGWRVGHILGKMRFIKTRENGTRTRQWKIRIADLAKRARSYGLEVPESFCSQDGL